MTRASSMMRTTWNATATATQFEQEAYAWASLMLRTSSPSAQTSANATS